MIGRRALLALLAEAAVAARAAEPGRLPRLGFLLVGAPPARGREPVVEEVLEGLAARSLSTAQLQVQVRYGHHQAATLARGAAELVAAPVDLIVARLTPAVVAARQATTRIPIVMWGAADPVGMGLVASMARPGGNVTGVAGQGPEMAAKVLELLREWLPQARRVAVLANADDPWTPLLLAQLEAAASSLGLALSTARVTQAAPLDAVFEAWARDGVDAVFVQPSLPQAPAAALARRYRLPAGSFVRALAAQGGLFGYGSDITQVNQVVADYVYRILQGASPAELPVQQATRYALTLNAGTARVLGLAIPPALRLRATEIIE